MTRIQVIVPLSGSGDDKEKRRQMLQRKRAMDSSVLEDLRGIILI